MIILAVNFSLNDTTPKNAIIIVSATWAIEKTWVALDKESAVYKAANDEEINNPITRQPMIFFHPINIFLRVKIHNNATTAKEPIYCSLKINKGSLKSTPYFTINFATPIIIMYIVIHFTQIL